METPVTTTVLGYPRIGRRRELKRAIEAYWAGKVTPEHLRESAAELRRATWTELRELGVDAIPSNTFSLYDHMLDTAVMFDAVPDRFADLAKRSADEADLDTYFAMARGAAGVAPMEMTKWFDTNYHYLVPELGPGTRLRLRGDKPVAEYAEARELGIETRPVVVGPLTFLLLAKPAPEATQGFRTLDLLDDLLDCYAEMLGRLARAGADWVQLDEPALTADRTEEELAALERAYRQLGDLPERPRLLVATYFGEIRAALPALAVSPVEAIGLDFVAEPGNLEALSRIGGVRDKRLVAGVVDGRNVWRTDLRSALSTCRSLLDLADELVVSSSCSLLHVPLDLDLERAMDPRVRARLAFARQKAAEVVLLGHALSEDSELVQESAAAGRHFEDPRVRARLDAGVDSTARPAYATRVTAQRSANGLPPLPTTTIGSFPQTDEIRKARADHRAGRIDTAEYERRMRAEIDRVVALQEDIGLDVLVHGEPERNDMVQYFAERLSGFAATEHGWVQSYGSRYVRPPILYGDVSRPEPITVGWATYAQSRTGKPVKGMLTGPVTMLAWSFVRDDQPLADTARQVALALRDEIHDLEGSGIRIIQVDEPALREKLPLRQDAWNDYLDWAVGAFRLATSGVAESTQVHTHMCYSEFGEIIGAIEDLDADVTYLEAARSRMELVGDLREAGYRRGVGPGVYDIHSPRVPTEDEIERALMRALEAVDANRLWVNPDCGLKTRRYAEVEPALRNMVEAAKRVRDRVAHRS